MNCTLYLLECVSLSFILFLDNWLVSSEMNPSRAPLQFINVTDPKEIKDAEIQTLVKTHVMRAFRREERLNTEKEATASARQSPSQPSLNNPELQPAIVRYSCNKGTEPLSRRHAVLLSRG